MGVYQLQYVRRRDATPLTRNYMFEDEQRLAGVAAPLHPG
jgi:hypothetical protein